MVYRQEEKLLFLSGVKITDDVLITVKHLKVVMLSKTEAEKPPIFLNLKLSYLILFNYLMNFIL